MFKELFGIIVLLAGIGTFSAIGGTIIDKLGLVKYPSDEYEPAPYNAVNGKFIDTDNGKFECVAEVFF